MQSSWDVFCRVVDNYGDAGVCWRLAKQLRRTHATRVRLWIDDLERLHRLSPELDPQLASQTVAGIDVNHWSSEPIVTEPADIVVEAFGCGLPERFIECMAGRSPAPLWITLEYLSAEPWVREHHGLPSPHPRWPLARYFFFPGFEPGTGGLLREADLLERRARHGPAERERLWRELGYPTPDPGASVVAVFGYRDAPLPELLSQWEHSTRLTVAAISEGELADRVFADLGHAAKRGAVRRGNVEVRVVPFVPQERYDALLWSCDCAFVRGEDSFVRAQWAGRPFVWNIYPQSEQAHRIKLDAFLGLYCASLPDTVQEDVRVMWHAWNQTGQAPVTVGAAWNRFWSHEALLGAHARDWCENLTAAGELAENLAQFCRDKLK